MDDSVVLNDEDIKYEIIIIDDDDRFVSDIDPPKTKYWKLKEWSMISKEGKLKEWTQKIKEWIMKSHS